MRSQCSNPLLETTGDPGAPAQKLRAGTVRLALHQRQEGLGLNREDDYAEEGVLHAGRILQGKRPQVVDFLCGRVSSAADYQDRAAWLSPPICPNIEDSVSATSV